MTYLDKKNLKAGAGGSKLNILYALNKRTNVYSMTVTSIDVLYSYIVPVFQSMPFLTRKAIDFHY